MTAGPEPGCFKVEFLTPADLHFWVSTEEMERVTVGLDAHHAHFGGWAESNDAQDFKNAVEYIRKLVTVGGSRAPNQAPRPSGLGE